MEEYTVDSIPDEGYYTISREFDNMMLVKTPDGELKPIANSPKNNLLYKHNLHEVLFSDESHMKKLVLSRDPYLAISANEDNDTIYTLWKEKDKFPLQNPPKKAYEVLKAVRTAIEDKNFEEFKQIYDWISDHQVNKEIINNFINWFPATSVVVTDDGWEVEGLFVVTWTAEVFLITDDINRLSGTGKEFLSLVPEDNPEPMEVKYDGKTYQLGETEMLFLTKVKSLLNYQDLHENEATWDVIKRHVRRKGSTGR